MLQHWSVHFTLAVTILHTKEHIPFQMLVMKTTLILSLIYC